MGNLLLELNQERLGGGGAKAHEEPGYERLVSLVVGWVVLCGLQEVVGGH